MMLKIAPLALLVILGACATDEGPQSYTLGRGLMSYDGFRRASDDCKERGGTVKPKDEGGDMAQMSNYTCVVPNKKSK